MFGSMEFCNTLISIGYFIFVVVIFSDAYASNDCCSINQQFCSKNTTHISCTNNGKWGFDDSCKSAYLIGMGRTRIQLLLDLHNSRRQLLASGGIKGFETASQMGAMKWSKELAQIACYNVFQCVYGHDGCRNTDKCRSAGQNLYLHYCKFPKTDMESLMREACTGWWEEHHDCDMELMNSFQPNPDLCTGHFTQMARDKSNSLGCGMGHWIEDGLHQYYLVCNYGMTSTLNRKIYASGIAASGCKSGPDSTHPALCSPMEIYMSELEEMEMEYDLAHGIETSVETASSTNSLRKSKRSHSPRRSKSARAKSTATTATTVNRNSFTGDAKARLHHQRSPGSHRHGHSHSQAHANAYARADAH